MSWYIVQKGYHHKLHWWGKSFQVLVSQQLAWPWQFIHIFSSLFKKFSPTLFSFGLALMGLVFFSRHEGCQQSLYTCICMLTLFIVLASSPLFGLVSIIFFRVGNENIKRYQVIKYQEVSNPRRGCHSTTTPSWVLVTVPRREKED